MSVKIIVLFNLKPEISTKEYETWAKEKDIPTVNALNSINKFEVFKSVSLLGSEEKPPYDYIEILDINDMDEFGKDTSTNEMNAIAGEFQAIATNLSFILTDKLG